MLLKNKATLSLIYIVILFNFTVLKASEPQTPEQKILFQKFERAYRVADQQLREAYKTSKMLEFTQMQKTITLKELSGQKFQQTYQQSRSTNEYKEFVRLAGEVGALQQQLEDHNIYIFISYSKPF